MFVLPYELILPRILSKNELKSIYNALTLQEVRLYFPKFTYENTHYLLKSIMNQVI